MFCIVELLMQEQSGQIQSELAGTVLEGYSEDETVCVTMSGNQVIISVSTLLRDWALCIAPQHVLAGKGSVCMQHSPRIRLHMRHACFVS